MKLHMCTFTGKYQQKYRQKYSAIYVSLSLSLVFFFHGCVHKIQTTKLLELPEDEKNSSM